MNISWFWLTNCLLLLPQIILVLYHLCSRNPHSLRMRLEQRKAVERLGRDYLASLNMWHVTCTCVRVGLRWASAKWWRQLATPKNHCNQKHFIILAACVMYVIVVPWVSRVYEICTLRVASSRAKRAKPKDYVKGAKANWFLIGFFWHNPEVRIIYKN